MDINILSCSTYKNFSLVQFNQENEKFDMEIGDIAVANKLIEILESSESGSVNTLIINNKSDKYVFFMDGDLLIGAKQNRILNTSILVAPNSISKVPVSCVERGRWEYISKRFSVSFLSAPGKLRMQKTKNVTTNLRQNKLYDAKQSEIWEKVTSYEESNSTSSFTSDLNDVYSHKNSLIDDFQKAFVPDKDSTGFAIFEGNKLFSIDQFNNKTLYTHYFNKIVKAFSIEITDNFEGKKLDESELKYKTLDFYDKIQKSEFSEHDAVCSGKEKRYQDKLLTGFELNYNGNLIHMSIFNIE